MSKYDALKLHARYLKQSLDRCAASPPFPQFQEVYAQDARTIGQLLAALEETELEVSRLAYQLDRFQQRSSAYQKGVEDTRRMAEQVDRWPLHVLPAQEP